MEGLPAGDAGKVQNHCLKISDLDLIYLCTSVRQGHSANLSFTPASAAFWAHQARLPYMKYSHLVPILTCLIASFGEVSEQEATQFQEEFCGEGQLTAGVRLFGLKADRRDVVCLQTSVLLFGHYNL